MSKNPKKICSLLCDFDLCDQISGALDHKYGYKAFEDDDLNIPEDRRTIHCVWSISGYLGNEGFVQFWYSKYKHQRIAKYFDNVGHGYMAMIFRKSLELVPEAALGNEELVEHVFGGWENTVKAAEPFENDLYRNEAAIERKLACYIRLRIDQFSDLEKHILESIASEIQNLEIYKMAACQSPSVSVDAWLKEVREVLQEK